MSNTPPDTQQSTLGASTGDREEIGLLDLMIVLAKRKGMIAAVSITAAVASALLSLLLSDVYTGTAKILPPQQGQSAVAMMLGQLGGLAGLANGSLGIKNPSDLYVGMLKSRTVADNIIKQFELQKVYEQDTMVETRKEFSDNSTITSGKDGLITIEFDDEDPVRAAAIANAYVDELDKLTQTLAVTEAAQRRLFFERQLQQVKNDLSEAELALKKTQETTGLIKLDDQGRAIIEAVATIRAQISAKEVELRAMRTYTTEQNPDYVRTQQQLAGLRNELLKLERSSVSGQGDIMLPTGKVPEAGLEYLRRYREVKYQEAIFELLARQFEAAKIDEAKEAAIVQVVDRAIQPDKMSKPRRALIVMVTTVVGAVVSILLSLLLETITGARSPSEQQRLRLLQSYLRIKN